jgi:hypothetical protein
MEKPEPHPRSVELVASLDDLTRHYLVTALWSSADESDPETGGLPMDENYELDDLAPEAIEQAIKDCAAFLAKCGNALCDGVLIRNTSGSTPEQMAGHDFWLTRNGHGAGFGDGDWADPLDDMLRDIAKGFRQVDLYVGDDGRIYAM